MNIVKQIRIFSVMEIRYILKLNTQTCRLCCHFMHLCKAIVVVVVVVLVSLTIDSWH